MSSPPVRRFRPLHPVSSPIHVVAVPFPWRESLFHTTHVTSSRPCDRGRRSKGLGEATTLRIGSVVAGDPLYDVVLWCMNRGVARGLGGSDSSLLGTVGHHNTGRPDYLEARDNRGRRSGRVLGGVPLSHRGTLVNSSWHLGDAQGRNGCDR